MPFGTIRQQVREQMSKITMIDQKAEAITLAWNCYPKICVSETRNFYSNAKPVPSILFHILTTTKEMIIFIIHMSKDRQSCLELETISHSLNTNSKTK